MMKNCVTSLQSNGTKKLAIHTVGSKRAKKKLAMFITSLSLVVGSALTAMAEEVTTVDLSQTLRSSINSMVNDFLGYVAIVLPIGLTVFGAVWGIKRAKQFFSTVAKG